MQARKRFFLCSARKENSNGWGYEMIYSKSGLAEAGAVYTTSFKGEEDTVWIVTIHDPVINKIEFVRVTSKSMASIQVSCTCFGTQFLLPLASIAVKIP
jgi:hypothetical protein